jgi:peptidoglycan/LPS O-acetylase OafA/YrhL
MMKNIPSLTAIRGMAAVITVIYHIPVFNDLPDSFSGDFLPGGYLAVDLFFVLSGFIMAYVHGADFFGPKATSRYWGFLRLRFFRIYPVHFVVLSTLLLYETAKLLSGHTFTHAPFSLNTIGTAVSGLFLVQAWGVDAQFLWNPPSWSISTEAAAYIMTPLIFWLMLRRSWRAWLMVFFAAGALAAIYTGTGDIGVMSGPLALIRCFAGYVIGVAVLRAYTALKDNAAACRIMVVMVPVAFAGAAICFLFAGLDLLSIAVFALIVFGLALTGDAFFARAVANPVCLFLGNISYSLYMVHAPIFSLSAAMFRQAMHSPTAQIPTALVFAEVAGALLVATFMFRYIEKPARALGRRYGRRDQDAIAKGLSAVAQG